MHWISLWHFEHCIKDVQVFLKSNHMMKEIANAQNAVVHKLITHHPYGQADPTYYMSGLFELVMKAWTMFRSSVATVWRVISPYAIDSEVVLFTIAMVSGCYVTWAVLGAGGVSLRCQLGSNGFRIKTVLVLKALLCPLWFRQYPALRAQWRWLTWNFKQKKIRCPDAQATYLMFCWRLLHLQLSISCINLNSWPTSTFREQ